MSETAARRSALLVQLLIVAGCAAPGHSGGRAPLGEAHTTRSHANGLPAPRQPQGPEPAQSGSGPRGYYVPGGTTRWSAEIDVGTIDFEAPGTGLHDHATTRGLRVGVDGAADLPSGPALQLRAFTSDDDLFAGRFISDGVSPQPASAEAFGLQAFPNLRFDTAAGPAQVTSRLGVLLDHLALHHDIARIDRSWLTLGVRVETEPRITVGKVNGVDIELFGRFGGEVGYSRFRETYSGSDDEDQTQRLGYNAGLGLGWREDNWTVDLGYEFGQTHFGGTDTGLFGARDSVRFEHQLVFLGGSVRL